MFLSKAIITVCFLVFSMSINAQDLKIAVVDIQTVVLELPEAKAADKTIKELGKKYQDTLLKMQEGLEEKFSTYQKQKGMMNAQQKEQTEMEVQALNQQVMQYQQEKFGQQGELAMMQRQFLEPLRDKIKTAIDNIAQKEGFNLILDKSGEGVLFASDKFDITYKILDVLKRGDEK